MTPRSATQWLARARRTSTRMAILAAALVFAAAAAAAPAGAAIYDPDVTPTASWTIDAAGGDDDALDVAVNSGGAAYVCGQVTSVGGDLDGSLFKFPRSGAGWRKTWDGPAHSNDAFVAVAVARNGSVYTAGANRNAAGQLDMRLVKWSSAGAKLWSRRYTGPVAGNDTATDVVVDSKGRVTVCGDSQGRSGKAFTVVSWTASGTRRWVRRIEGERVTDDRAEAMIVDSSGNLYVTGRRSYEVGTAGYTVKLSPAGVTKWRDDYTGADTIDLQALTRRPGGGVYVCGSALGFDTGWDGLVMKYTAAGTRTVFTWDVGDGADSTDTNFNAVAATPTGQVVAVGSVAYDYGAHTHRRFAVYDAATGTFTGATYSAALHETFTAVAADAYGGVYFTGMRALSASHTTVWTHRYSSIPDGGTWTGEFGTGWASANVPTAIATWRTTVWVVGRAYPGTTGADQLVLKYLY